MESAPGGRKHGCPAPGHCNGTKLIQALAVIAFLSGVLAGSLHVISGPDHVAAVAPLAVRTPGAGSALGAVWGIGHGGGVLLWVAAAALFQSWFGRALPSAALEAMVGVALIALGTLSLHRSRHPGAHGHVHADARWGRGRGAALALGALHGSAGASHLLALLPTLGLPGHGALSYAGGYLLAGVFAMASVGSMIGRLSLRIEDPARLQRICAWSVAAVGAFWLISSLRELVSP